MKKLLIILCLVFVNTLFASSDYDKDIIVLNQSRDDKVKIVFDQMMQAYEEEDSNAFFHFVWEDRFLQDYMTFSEAIDNDFRKYEIISFDSWIDKITTDGIKKYLYVKWEKRYETNDGSRQLTQKGYSRFLFDEMNGQYKLIEIAGNNLWGASLAEWTQEVPDIVGQEREVVIVENDEGTKEEVVAEQEDTLPDLIISNAVCQYNNNDVEITLKNQGEADAVPSKYIIVSNITGNGYPHTLAAGEEVTFTSQVDVSMCGGTTFEVDPDDEIEEEDEDNNEFTTPNDIYPY
jgi:hypothetical protein